MSRSPKPTPTVTSEAIIERIVDLYAEACDAAGPTLHLDPRRFFDPSIFADIALEHATTVYEWEQAEKRAQSLYQSAIRRRMARVS